MSWFQDTLRALARSIGLQLRETYTETTEQGMEHPEQVRLLASIVESGNLRAMRLAELEVMRLEAQHPDVVRAGVIPVGGAEAQPPRTVEPPEPPEPDRESEAEALEALEAEDAAQRERERDRELAAAERERVLRESREKAQAREAEQEAARKRARAARRERKRERNREVREPETAPVSSDEVDRWTDPDRLEKAVNTILRSQEDEDDTPRSSQGMGERPGPENRLERLGRSEVAETGQNALHAALQTTEGVEGWRREMEPGACQLCQWWWREGRIWPKAHPMPKHKGCECTPEIVVAEAGTILETEKTKRMARAAAKAAGYESEMK